ncbi:MAG: hypothetical protein LIO71_03585 [Ruminococcus sp.]|nr:hypothetical protein [Ruminococcus sp.]
MTALAILLLILLIIFEPFLYFICGWFTGLLIEITFSNMFINGLALLGITITTSQIPLLCGTLGVIGCFFKTITTSKNN